jgi:hypothetical protein
LRALGGNKCDIWAVKLSQEGNIEWQKIFAGDYLDLAWWIEPTKDGGYILAAITMSFGLVGDHTILVTKLNHNGSIAWAKDYYSSTVDLESEGEIIQTSDGGYILTGITIGFGTDLFVFKLSSSGAVEWAYTYASGYEDEAHTIRETKDGGYIVFGETQTASEEDLWLIKLNNSGAVEWQKIYGGSKSDGIKLCNLTADGGYILTSHTRSFGAPGDIWDAWLLKLDQLGDIQWQKVLRGSGDDEIWHIQQTADGGYITAGGTSSFEENGDIWVVKLDQSGNVQWQRTYGGANADGGGIIRQLNDGGYLLLGETNSFGAGGWDPWVLKLRPDGSCPPFGTPVSTEVIDTSVVPGSVAYTRATLDVVTKDVTSEITVSKLTGVEVQQQN